MKTIGKEKLKIYKSLKLKKYRLKYNKFLVEGSKMISEVPASQIDRIECLFVSDEKFLPELATDLLDHIVFITNKEMKALSSMKTPPGVLAVIKDCDVKDLSPGKAILGPWIGLEGISDPGNLGTIVRSAAWFGYKHMVLIGDCVDPYNNKVVQASMGSFWNVQFYRADLSELAKIKTPLLIADMGGLDYRSFDWPENFILVLGGESQGLSNDLRALAQESLGVPSVASTVTDSLNLSITASILMAASVP